MSDNSRPTRKFRSALRVVMGMKISEYRPIFTKMGISLDYGLNQGGALMTALMLVREANRHDEFVRAVDEAVSPATSSDNNVSDEKRYMVRVISRTFDENVVIDTQEADYQRQRMSPRCNTEKANLICSALNAQERKPSSDCKIDSEEMALSTLVAITNMTENKHVIEMAEQCYLFFANAQESKPSEIPIHSQNDIGICENCDGKQHPDGEVCPAFPAPSPDALLSDVTISRDAEKKAFWAAFEIATMNPDSKDIQKHWNEFKALQEQDHE